MARFLFFTWSGGGNQPPAIGIAQELRERGHTVRFAGDASQRARLTDLGFSFTLLARSSAARKPGLAGVVAGVMASHEHLADVPDAVREAQDDVLVIDCLMFGALAAAEAAGLPVAVLVHSAPGLLGEPHGWLEGFLLEAVNRVRAAARLAPVAALWDVWARFPTLCVTIPALDPLAARVPASFAYVGPAFERVPTSGWSAPWPADDPRPLVLVSFSTLRAWDQAPRIRRTLDGLADCPYRVLVTTGQADVTGIAVPENAVLVGHVPHAAVLPLVAVTVTHAGHGTVTAALAHGVPLVCLPNPAGDQPGLAAQVAALGAGLSLDGESATAADIAGAVDTVLEDPTYAAVARRLAQAIAAMPGAATAASRLEQVVAHPRGTG